MSHLLLGCPALASPIDSRVYLRDHDRRPSGLVTPILAIGLMLTYAGRTVARWAALVAQLLALLGDGTGVYMATRGMAPNTTLDFAYHAFAIVLLVAGLVVAWRLPSEADEDTGARAFG